LVMPQVEWRTPLAAAWSGDGETLAALSMDDELIAAILAHASITKGISETVVLETYQKLMAQPPYVNEQIQRSRKAHEKTRQELARK
jgi:hypothetical protein